MDKDLINRIYEMQIDIENCDETIKDVLEAGTKYIRVNFNTWGLKHPLGKYHEVKIPTNCLADFLRLGRDRMQEEYGNMLNILKNNKNEL